MTKNNIFLELKSLEIIQTEFLVWLNRLTLGKFLNALKCIIINPSIYKSEALSLEMCPKVYEERQEMVRVPSSVLWAVCCTP